MSSKLDAKSDVGVDVSSSMDRRRFIGGVSTAAASAGLMSGLHAAQAAGQGAAAQSRFTPATVEQRARDLAKTPFKASTYKPPPPLGTFGYDQYRDIRFRPDLSIWREAGAVPASTSLQFFLASFIYPHPVEIHLVEGGVSRALPARRDLFDFGPSDPEVPKDADFAFSGFRVHGPLNKPNVADEVIAFNGASYFRALGKGHTYGLSARGLAINTVGDTGEEFPTFTAFWIEKPNGLSLILIHALLDSPSVTGAYHFTVKAGAPTVMDVQATLFPRKVIEKVGLAPLTSMFLFDSRDHNRFRDFRAAVHDSDGLAIEQTNGERVWRPLLNPVHKLESFFHGASAPKFGLIQRKRTYDDFFDLEANYEARPSAWVEPVGNWGAGHVALLELPIGAEWGDNIVAFWQRQEALQPGVPFRYAYRLHWRDEVPYAARRVLQTRLSVTHGKPLFVIDYEPIAGETELPQAIVTSSHGTTSRPVVQRNSHNGGVRVFFSLDPQGHSSADLRVVLKAISQSQAETFSAPETWLYRWAA